MFTIVAGNVNLFNDIQLAKHPSPNSKTDVGKSIDSRDVQELNE